jgi:hypothetical protein
MTTKTIQQLFIIGGVPADVTSIVLRDPSNTYGIRRTDTLAIVVAAGVSFTHVSTGVYSYQFTEPAAGLDYQYSIEWVYDGITHYKNQVLETTASGGAIPLTLTTYAQMGVDTVACGDATLVTFLTAQANLIWAIQTRRGVALDLQYQYYVSDLITLALDHVRMLIDTETGDSAMTDTANSDALNTSSANQSSARARSSSFTESSSSSQNMSRTATRSSSSSSVLHASNSASRNASSSDTSTIAQSSSGSSSRTQTGLSTAKGALAPDGTSGQASSSYVSSTISKNKHEVITETGGLAGNPSPSIIVDDGTLTSAYVTGSVAVLALGTASVMQGASGVGHKQTPSTLGRISPGGAISTDGAPGSLAMLGSSASSHARSLIGSQTGTGSSTFSSSGTRVNNRTGSSVSSSNSSMTGNASSSMSSSSHDDQTRTAASASHSESAFNSSMTASSTRHSEMAATDAMAANGSIDREYYSQIFDSLKQMWEDTQEIIRKLESQMLLASQYLVNKLTVTTPQSTLVGQVSLKALPTLTQRPGVRSPIDPFAGAFNRFIVR